MSNNFKGVTCIRILTKNPPSPLQGSGRSGPPLRVQSGPVLPRWCLAGATPWGGPLVENAKRLPDRVEHRFPDKQASPEHPKRGNFIFINSYAYYIKIKFPRFGCFHKSQIAATCRGPVGQPSDLARGSNLLKAVCKEKIDFPGDGTKQGKKSTSTN